MQPDRPGRRHAPDHLREQRRLEEGATRPWLGTFFNPNNPVTFLVVLGSGSHGQARRASVTVGGPGSRGATRPPSFLPCCCSDASPTLGRCVPLGGPGSRRGPGSDRGTARRVHGPSDPGGLRRAVQSRAQAGRSRHQFALRLPRHGLGGSASAPRPGLGGSERAVGHDVDHRASPPHRDPRPHPPNHPPAGATAVGAQGWGVLDSPGGGREGGRAPGFRGGYDQRCTSGTDVGGAHTIIPVYYRKGAVETGVEVSDLRAALSSWIRSRSASAWSAPGTLRSSARSAAPCWTRRGGRCRLLSFRLRCTMTSTPG